MASKKQMVQHYLLDIAELAEHVATYGDDEYFEDAQYLDIFSAICWIANGCDTCPIQHICDSYAHWSGDKLTTTNPIKFEFWWKERRHEC